MLGNVIGAALLVALGLMGLVQLGDRSAAEVAGPLGMIAMLLLVLACFGGAVGCLVGGFS